MTNDQTIGDIILGTTRDDNVSVFLCGCLSVKVPSLSGPFIRTFTKKSWTVQGELRVNLLVMTDKLWLVWKNNASFNPFSWSCSNRRKTKLKKMFRKQKNLLVLWKFEKNSRYELVSHQRLKTFSAASNSAALIRFLVG